MIVIEKQKDTTVLRVLGATDSFVQRVFLFEGLLLALIGYVIGIILAITVCLLQQQYGFVKLQGGSFVIDAYPVSMHLTDFIIVFFTVILIGVVAAWVPSKRSSVIDLRTI